MIESKLTTEELSKIAYDTGVIYGRLRHMKDTNPFHWYISVIKESFAKGMSDGYDKPKFEKGESFTVSDIHGNQCLCVRDDLDVGDSVAMLGKHGLISNNKGESKIVPVKITKFCGRKELSGLIVDSNEWVNGWVSFDNLGLSYHPDCVLRWIG